MELELKILKEKGIETTPIRKELNVNDALLQQVSQTKISNLKYPFEGEVFEKAIKQESISTAVTEGKAGYEREFKSKV